VLTAGLSQFIGGQVGGPLILFDESFKPGPGGKGKPMTLIIAPFSHFKSSILAVVNNRLVAGIQGYVNELEPTFSSQFIVVPSSAGINDCMCVDFCHSSCSVELAVVLCRYRFGKALRLWYNTSRTAPAADPVSYKLSYWTGWQMYSIHYDLAYVHN
jgi:hypothetical protein